MKKVWVIMPWLLVAAGSCVLGQEFKRFEVQALGGLSVSGDIPLIGDDGVEHGTVQVANSYNLGAAFAVNFNELDAVEGVWQRQFSEGRLGGELAFPIPTATAAAPTFNMRIDRIHGNFLHHYRLHDPRAFPYVMAGAGVTTYYAGSGGQTNSKSNFSFALGGGIKYFLTEHFGFRGEARWNPTVLSASDSSFWCHTGGFGGQCLIHLKAVVQEEVDLTGGVVFRF